MVTRPGRLRLTSTSESVESRAQHRSALIPRGHASEESQVRGSTTVCTAWSWLEYIDSCQIDKNRRKAAEFPTRPALGVLPLPWVYAILCLDNDTRLQSGCSDTAARFSLSGLCPYGIKAHCGGFRNPEHYPSQNRAPSTTTIAVNKSTYKR
jgi:hypothetical protein